MLEESLAESLNTTRATRRNTKSKAAVLEETVTDPVQTSRSTRRTTKTVQVVEQEETAVESQPASRSNKR